MVNLLEALGYAHAHHSAFQVRTGMLNAAVFFFTQLGWTELKDLKVTGDWGTARFVLPSHEPHIVQLTELADGDPEKLEMTENHLAIRFSNAKPEDAALSILEWAVYSGAADDASIEPANATGSKWFVYLPALFKFAIEIV